MVNWRMRDFSNQDPNQVKWFAEWSGSSELAARIIISRGFDTDEKFYEYMSPSLSQLRDPFTMNDMRKAVDRIIRAIRNKEKIMIYGDYDCDGITSTSILYKGLKRFNANVGFRLPLRKDGYGITPSAVDKMVQADGASLIVTVDNGSTAHDALAHAKKMGVDVIVTDHHDIIGGKHPDCFAFINPKRSDSTYGFRYLCGAGVALKVVEALYSKNHHYSWHQEDMEYLQLTTLGTIADLVPLVGENRAIVHLGLHRMNSKPSPVFASIFRQLRIRGNVDSTTIGFRVAPLFNAAGRISDPNSAVYLLTNTCPSEHAIRTLIDENEERKKLTFEQTLLANEIILDEGSQDKDVIVVAGPFHPGVIGLISSRLSERYQKPSIVISHEGGKGSARGGPNPDFSIVDTIERCGEYLKGFGGHKGAAGLSMETDKVPSFSRAIQLSAQMEKVSSAFRHYDGVMPLDSINGAGFVNRLQILEPTGLGNPKPVFRSPKTRFLASEEFGKFEKHLKLLIKDGKCDQVQAFAFGKGLQLSEIQSNTELDILYSPMNYRQAPRMSDLRFCKSDMYVSAFEEFAKKLKQQWDSLDFLIHDLAVVSVGRRN